jgi:hypothetical protein
MKPELKLTDLRPFLRKEIPSVWADKRMETKRLRALMLLGNRWLLHPSNAPKKGDYTGWPTSLREAK